MKSLGMENLTQSLGGNGYRSATVEIKSDDNKQKISKMPSSMVRKLTLTQLLRYQNQYDLNVKDILKDIRKFLRFALIRRKSHFIGCNHSATNQNRGNIFAITRKTR
uniref:Uncharacterized protein n=1 Tax=Cacopsylla melanoneura TaxID=428564 RepID=A0A8D8ZDD0_9HEMI